MSSPKQLGTVGNNAIIFSNLRLFKLNPQTYAYFQFPEKIQNQHISIISKLQKSQNIIQVAFVEVAVPIIQQEPVKASAKDEISKVLPVLRCFFRCPFLHQRTSIIYEKIPCLESESPNSSVFAAVKTWPIRSLIKKNVTFISNDLEGSKCALHRGCFKGISIVWRMKDFFKLSARVGIASLLDRQRNGLTRLKAFQNAAGMVQDHLGSH